MPTSSASPASCSPSASVSARPSRRGEEAEPLATAAAVAAAVAGGLCLVLRSSLCWLDRKKLESAVDPRRRHHATAVRLERVPRHLLHAVAADAGGAPWSLLAIGRNPWLLVVATLACLATVLQPPAPSPRLLPTWSAIPASPISRCCPTCRGSSSASGTAAIRCGPGTSCRRQRCQVISMG